MEKKSSFIYDLLICLVFLFIFIVYYNTTAPTVLFGDGARFQICFRQWGLAHSPGYPIYSMLVKMMVLFPLGDHAFRASLFSGWCALFTLLVLYKIAGVLSIKRSLRLLVVTVVAFSLTFWFQSVRAEVYTLETLLISLAVYFAARYFEKNQLNDLIFSTLWWAVATSFRINLIFMFFFHFAFLCYQLMKNRRLGSVLWIAALCTLPFLVNLAYIMIVDFSKCGYNYIDIYNSEFHVLPTGKSFADLFDRAVWLYSCKQFQNSVFSFHIKHIFSSIVFLFKPFVFRNLSILWLFFAGYAIAVKRKWIVYILAFLVVMNLSYTIASTAGDRQSFILPSIFGLTILGAIGIDTICKTMKLKFSAVLFVLPIFLLLVNFKVADRSDLYLYEILAKEAIESLQEDTTVFCEQSFSTTLVYQTTYVNKRPDLKIIPMHLENVSHYLSVFSDIRNAVYVDVDFDNYHVNIKRLNAYDVSK